MDHDNVGETIGDMFFRAFPGNHQVASDRALVAFCDDVAKFLDKQQRGYASTVCVAVAKNETPIVSFNDIPNCSLKEYTSTGRGVERAGKFVALGHAEQLVVAGAAREGISMEGATLALNWFPCINCAYTVARSGVSALIGRSPDFDYKPDQYDFAAAYELLLAHDIDIRLIDAN